MLTASKNKWLISLFIAGILLALALFGGTWGTTYAADNEVILAPQINFINPTEIAVGSPDTPFFIQGSGFGSSNDTGVRVEGNGVDNIYYGLVYPTMIFGSFPADLFGSPTVYNITVVMSVPKTVPTIPITPYDVESNIVPLRVYETQFMYLPTVTKLP